MEVPCGRCMGCRIDRTRDWSIRITHEAQMHEENCFITLTYNDDNLPLELGYEDFQKFIRRLRKKTGAKIRFYMCAEYGERTQRPHYHAILFGYNFPDRTHLPLAKSDRLYESALLNKLWPYGYASIGGVSPTSAAYVARYLNKKQSDYNPDGSPVDATAILDPDTGVIRPRQPAFSKMSLKPGIGESWLKKYFSDVFPADRVVWNGQVKPAPKYYRDKLEEWNPEMAEELRQRRIEKAKENCENNTDERLEVREKVAVLKQKRFTRDEDK